MFVCVDFIFFFINYRFIPFGLISANILCNSEVYNYKNNVTPTILHSAIRVRKSNDQDEILTAISEIDITSDNDIDPNSDEFKEAMELLKTTEEFELRLENEKDFSDPDAKFFRYFFNAYYLCTNENPNPKKRAARLIYPKNPTKRENVIYVPSIKGSYPWPSYKQQIIELLQKEPKV